MKQITDSKVVLKVHDNNFNINLIHRKRDAITDVLATLFGETINLVIETQVNKDNDLNEKIDKTNRLKKKALQHPLVSEVINIFNGKVVDVKLL